MSGIERRPSQANPKLSEVLMSSGTVLFKEGDRADAMYIVQQGEIEISIQRGEHALATLEKGANQTSWSTLNASGRTRPSASSRHDDGNSDLYMLSGRATANSSYRMLCLFAYANAARAQLAILKNRPELN